MRLALAIACLLSFASCKAVERLHPTIGDIQAGLIQSPLKVCPVRMLNPLKEGEKRWVYVNLYSREW